MTMVYIMIALAVLGVPVTLLLARRQLWLATFGAWYYTEALAAGAAGSAFHYGSLTVGILMTLVTFGGIIGSFFVVIDYICKPRRVGRGFLFIVRCIPATAARLLALLPYSCPIR